jgi:chemotaxis protein methyltransferase CheR
VTGFFRETRHFDFLQDVFSEWIAQGQRRFRLWSAACSTGEESYSLAMTFHESANGQITDMKILATDISTRALETCRDGVYKKEKAQAIPPILRERYFKRRRNETGIFYAARKIVRKSIVFKRLNLSTPPFPLHGPFDVILCRNVMIYFDNHVRSKLLAEMYRLLRNGGYLFVGHAESLTGMMSDFQSVKPSIYTKH